MPLTEAKPDALANTYARSLYELTFAAGGRDNVESALGQLEDVLETARQDPRFGEFLSSRVIPSAARETSLKVIFQDALDNTVLNFLLVINKKDRLSHLPAIVAALDAMVQDAFGRIEVDIYTAHPINPNDLKDIKDRLTSHIEKDVIVHPYTDASMIGGVKLRLGDQLIDASIAARLSKVKEQLSTHGQATLRTNISNAIQDES